MANTQLFRSPRTSIPPTDCFNEAGGPAYAFSAKHALAQYAATGCLNGTYYANAETQLVTLMELCREVDSAFIAKTAVYCRERGYMKDTPALLLAILTLRGPEYVSAVFPRVINNGKMVRNFVQILRSGAVGRKSLGTRPKKLVQNWLNSASEQALLQAAVGNQPSLADVVKMVHPKPNEAWRAAFFAWLVDKPYVLADLPEQTQAFERYKQLGAKARSKTSLPQVPFQMLTALELGREQWAEIARQAGWQMLRMNLNTLTRHGVFEIPGMITWVAAQLKKPAAIAHARVLPYQLLAAYQAADKALPVQLREALQDALELALVNVPELEGRVVVCPDVSGSMASPVTGQRGSASTAVRCIDVAALVAAALLRKNPHTLVLPFSYNVEAITLNMRDTVLTNAQKLAAIGGGGTDCSAPLRWMNVVVKYFRTLR